MRTRHILVVVLALFGGVAGAQTPAGSRLGINLSAPADWNTELPFVDVFHLSREWISQRQGAPWGQGPTLDLDANGWVRRLEPGAFAETLLLTMEGGKYPAGEYVVLYDGVGRIELTAVKRVITRTAGRIVFEPNPANGFTLQLRETDPANPVRNIRVLTPGSEATYKDNPWSPAFLARWRGMNTIRFMDWMLTNEGRVKEWSERPTPGTATFTTRGVPVELMVDLANRLGANPWFCMPHEASDDYVRRFAQLVRATLKPELTPYIEYSNEIWNYGFAQTQYAGDRGLAAGLHSQHWEAAWRFSARRSVEIFRIWQEVYGGTGKFVRVMASQAANAYISDVKLAFEDAYKSVDALAIAPYFTLNLSAESDPTAATVAGWPVDRVLDQLQRVSIPEAEGWIRESLAVAKQYGVRLIAYEGGQHAVGIGGAEGNDKLTALLMQANRHPRMGELYTRYLDIWKSAGGGDLFCVFASVGAWSRWGSWGLLEYAADDTPKYRAVLSWNTANPR